MSGQRELKRATMKRREQAKIGRKIWEQQPSEVSDINVDAFNYRGKICTLTAKILQEEVSIGLERNTAVQSICVLDVSRPGKLLSRSDYLLTERSKPSA